MTEEEKKAFEILKDEVARQAIEIGRWKRLSFDMLSMFHPSGKDKIATGERVEAWFQQWKELSGCDAEDYL